MPNDKSAFPPPCKEDGTGAPDMIHLGSWGDPIVDQNFTRPVDKMDHGLRTGSNKSVLMLICLR